MTIEERSQKILCFHPCKYITWFNHLFQYHHGKCCSRHHVMGAQSSRKEQESLYSTNSQTQLLNAHHEDSSDTQSLFEQFVLGWQDIQRKAQKIWEKNYGTENTTAKQSKLSQSEHYTDGHYTEGHYTNGHYTDGHYTDGHYTEGHYTDGHYTDGHYTEGHYTNGHYTDEHYTEGHYTDGHYTEGHYTGGVLYG